VNEGAPTGGVLRQKQTNKQTINQTAVLMKIPLPGLNPLSLVGQFPTFRPVVSKCRYAVTFSVKQSKKNQLAYLHGTVSCSTVVQVVEKLAVSCGIRSYITRCRPSPRICVRYDSMLGFYVEELLSAVGPLLLGLEELVPLRQTAIGYSIRTEL
jgi:hypothetical protein